jgi:hypothetical protein
VTCEASKVRLVKNLMVAYMIAMVVQKAVLKDNLSFVTQWWLRLQRITSNKELSRAPPLFFCKNSFGLRKYSQKGLGCSSQKGFQSPYNGGGLSYL